MRRYNITEIKSRKPHAKLNASYQVLDDEEQHIIGVCKIEDGIITCLNYIQTDEEYFAGRVLTTILTAACKEADSKDCFLYITISDSAQNLKKLLERYGFRDQGEFLLKRNPGSILPISAALVLGLSGGL